MQGWGTSTNYGNDFMWFYRLRIRFIPIPISKCVSEVTERGKI